MPITILNHENSNYLTNYVNEAQPTTAYSNLTTLVVGTGDASNKRNRIFLSYDFGLIPNNAIINKATLNLRVNGAITLDFHQVTSDWNGSVTWNSQPSFDPTPSASLTTSTEQSYQVDITQLVQRWVNGSMNYGILIKVKNETTLNSSKYVDNTNNNHPGITVDYSIPSTGKKQVEYLGIARTNNKGISISPSLPTGIQAGDLLVAFLIGDKSSSTVTIPSGWTERMNVSTTNGTRVVLAHKTAGAYEQPPTFQASEYMGMSVEMYAYRNVRAVTNFSHTVSGPFATKVTPLTSNMTASDEKAMLFVILFSNPTSAFQGPKSFSPGTGGSAVVGLVNGLYKYLYSNRTVTPSDVQFSTTQTQTVAVAMMIEPFTNTPPTLTLTAPSNSQTLTDGKTFTISGTASDIDAGNVVTIKYKINNGTARAINSGVSDGSTPIPFSKNLVFRNKRLWDGSTDVIGYDLAQGTNHTLTVWAEDDKGSKSPDTTRTFTVVWNRPPAISGQDKNLGAISSPPSESFSVTDPEGHPFTIEYYLDNQRFNSFSGVSGQTYTVTIAKDTWLRTSLKQHQLKIRAIDNQGAYSERIFTFTRTDDRIEFTLNYSNTSVKSFFTTNQKANRILVTMDAVIPTGAQLLVRACNNAYDAQPTWEDITGPVQAKRGYQFTNTTSTSGKWGINIHFKILKGTATETVLFNGFGGAFD